MDYFCNQNADQLGSLAGLSFPAVYVGVVECAPASPYTYSSSTFRFPEACNEEQRILFQGGGGVGGFILVVELNGPLERIEGFEEEASTETHTASSRLCDLLRRFVWRC
jgi:hypothetical protein